MLHPGWGWPGITAHETDIRPVGIDALLHFSLKRKENDPHEGEHKLELLDTGMKTYTDLVAQIEGTVECAIDDLELMRIDLCVDMYGIPGGVVPGPYAREV